MKEWLNGASGLYSKLVGYTVSRKMVIKANLYALLFISVIIVAPPLVELVIKALL